MNLFLKPLSASWRLRLLAACSTESLRFREWYKHIADGRPCYPPQPCRSGAGIAGFDG